MFPTVDATFFNIHGPHNSNTALSLLQFGSHCKEMFQSLAVNDISNCRLHLIVIISQSESYILQKCKKKHIQEHSLFLKA